MKPCSHCEVLNPDKVQFCIACEKPLVAQKSEQSFDSGESPNNKQSSDSGESPILEALGEVVDIVLDFASSTGTTACEVGGTALECTGSVLTAVAEGTVAVISATGEVVGAIISGISDGFGLFHSARIVSITNRERSSKTFIYFIIYRIHVSLRNGGMVIMGFNTVKKGGGFNVAKRVSSVLIQLGWDTTGPTKVDIDVHAFWLGANSTWIQGSGVSYALSCYNEDLKIFDPKTNKFVGGNHTSGDKRPFALDEFSLIHMGDARSGTAAVEIEEEIRANLANAPSGASELSIWITIHEANAKRQHFGMMDAGFIQVVNAEDLSDQQCRYDLTREFDGKTAIQVASFTRQDDAGWRFNAIGNGANADFMQIVASLGYSD